MHLYQFISVVFLMMRTYVSGISGVFNDRSVDMGWRTVMNRVRKDPAALAQSRRAKLAERSAVVLFFRNQGVPSAKDVF